MQKEVFNPWEVSGSVNYQRLVKEFGISPMPKLSKKFNENILFRRGIVFAQRDFDTISQAVEKKKPFNLMTGLMPSGSFHLGHLLVAQQMVFYQKLGAKLYIAVADLEAYNVRQKSLEELREIAIEQYLSNYIALGLKPRNCDFYFQSARSKSVEKSNAYYALASKFSRYATYNEFKAVYGDITPAKINSSTLQAADMFHPQLKEFNPGVPTFIPVGIDQDPHIRIARGMAKRFKDFKFKPISSTYHYFTPGLKSGKMSSSDPNSFIALTDSPSEVKSKINKYAFSGGKDTLEEHRKHGGNPDIDVSFQYLKFILEENDKKLAQLENDYRSGALTTGELKSYTIEKINSFLAKHQKAREKARKQIDKFL